MVQDPGSAYCPEMPSAAIAACRVDHVCPLEQMPSLLVDLTAKSRKVEES